MITQHLRMNKAIATILLGVLTLTVASCRGTRSSDPPIHPNLNMDFQQRFDPQEVNPFFEDNRSMRPLVPGTVARGTLRDDAAFYEGRNEGGGFLQRMPLPMTRELLERGQERYNIFCAVCHGAAGDGEGIVITGGYGYTPAPSYHIDRLRQESDGYLYDVITNGVRTMPPYGHQVPPADRWAIVAYIRALQRSQYASPEDVPANIRSDLPPAAGDTTAAAAGEPAGADTTAASGEVDASGTSPAGDTTATGGNE